MTRLYLIRHGETDWNIEGRWQGQIDLPLNHRGQQQADQIARSLAGSGISVIYSSDLQRAIDTAVPLGDRLGIGVHTDPRLREIHQGEWQGLSVKLIKDRYAREFQKRLVDPLLVAPPGGETGDEVRQRVVECVEEILERHPVETVAIVSHGFTIAVIIAQYKDIPFSKVLELVPGNASVQALDLSR